MYFNDLYNDLMLFLDNLELTSPQLSDYPIGKVISRSGRGGFFLPFYPSGFL